MNTKMDLAHSVTVTEYDHFISVSIANCEGEQIFVQYHRDQVRRNEDGVWQVTEGETPYYSARSSSASQPEVKLSPAVILALQEASKK